jgi:DNA-binding response OmpR family regulator
MKILLAEDDINISTIMAITLEQIGNHQVTVVEDGDSAVKEVQRNSYDLVILDGMMPKLDGFETCKKIKTELKLKMPVIFLSAKSDEESKAISKNLGAIGYIEKPFDPNQVCEQIDNILKKSG